MGGTRWFTQKGCVYINLRDKEKAQGTEMATKRTFFFDPNTLEDNHKIENHEDKCFFKKIPVEIAGYSRNTFVSKTIWVHIRVCFCNYSNLYPDRSKEYLVGDNLAFKDVHEKPGVEFHESSDCKWIEYGSNSLKRFCSCNRYNSWGMCYSAFRKLDFISFQRPWSQRLHNISQKVLLIKGS